MAAEQIVVLPYSSHAPLPLQWLVFPQVVGTAAVPHRAWGSSRPEPTIAQVPSATETVRALRHEWQASAQEVSQQTSSTQFPDVHSVPTVQATPLAPKAWTRSP